MSINHITSISSDWMGKITITRSAPNGEITARVYKCGIKSIIRLDRVLRERIQLDLGTPFFFRDNWQFVPWYAEEDNEDNAR